MSLFPESLPPKPLAERMRPMSLDQVLGQKDVCRLLHAYIDQAEMPSVVFWGPPGCGKTTLSRLMADLLGWEGRSLNATSASVKDIRDLASEAKQLWAQLEKRTLLFIDEIHRLNKGQQDVLLPIVESGSVVLAGSTTENPYFSLTGALRSRVQLVRLHPLSVEDLLEGIARAAKVTGVDIDGEAAQWIATRVAGDVRLALSVLEGAAILARHRGDAIALEDAAACLGQTNIAGDRRGDNHYDLASAFQKSLRGSDANAAIYYLARFIETGEDPRFIARRLLVTASEDVGNADPIALQIAADAFRAVEMLGLPEARIPLAQATLYVARAPKSNEAISAIEAASGYLKSRPLEPIPLHLRDAHYKGAEQLGHGKDYLYSHEHKDIKQAFLPDGAARQAFVESRNIPGDALDRKEREWLLKYLEEKHREGEWFELDVDQLGKTIQWPSSRVRNVLNGIVQEGRLSFKRSFRLH